MIDDLIDCLCGNYRLVRLLGRGSSSTIYLGEHELFHTPVAIKMLHEWHADQEKEKFLAQASVLSHLRHSHIIHVLASGWHEGRVYLVMDYVPNGTLRERHPHGERVPVETIGSYISQVAPALHYLHQHRLIHRDIKPHNMLISSEQKIMLNDFGTAVVSQSLDPNAELYDFEGSVAYAAPEQLQGRPQRSSDQYALGIVVYEWLCGAWPFSDTFDQVVHQHIFELPPSLREHVPDLSPAIEQVVMRALAKEPEERFPSVQAFADGLLSAFRNAPIHKPKRQFLSPQPFNENK